MIWKTILILLGVIIMCKFLEWIKSILNIHINLEDIKNLLSKDGTIRKDHQDIKDLLSEDGAIRKDHQKIINLLGENGTIREENKKIIEILQKNGGIETKVDNILKNQEYEKDLIKNLKDKDLDINKTIEHINALNKNYIDQKFEFQDLKLKKISLEEENKTIKNQNIKLNNEITELKNQKNELEEQLNKIKSENIELKNQKYLEQGDNNKLYQELLYGSNIRKDELLEIFKNQEICADKNGNAIFPIKNKIGEIVGVFELDINKNEPPKLNRNIYASKGNIEKAEVIANKVFKSLKSLNEKSKEIEKNYEQEL